MKYSLGLDLGITSIGWSMVGLDEDGNATHIIDANVTTLESIEDDKGELKNVSRREARGIRRTIRRRAHRVKRVKYLLSTLGVDVDTIYNVQSKVQFNPYYLKNKGLNEKLDLDELAICLIHYAKHRGFKSNRKSGVDEADGDLLKSVSENKKILEANNLTVSQYLYSKYIDLDGKDKLKNTTGDYKYLFDRQTYKDEIELFLENQITLGTIDEDFKANYIKIWESQRDFSEGPGSPSPYAVDFAKSFGYCNFKIDGETMLRAPKCAPTTEIFTLLQKLNNIRYNKGKEKNIRLTREEIIEILDLAKNKANLNYADIMKVVGSEVSFQGLDLPKDKFIKLVRDYKEKKNLDNGVNIDFKDEDFVKELNKEKNSIKVGKLTNFMKIKKVFKDSGYLEIFENMPIEYLDDIVTGLTFYKTENRILNYFMQEGEQEHSTLDWSLYPSIVSEVIPFIPTFNESASLSLELMRKLNKLLINGLDYYEAMKELGYDHSAPISDAKKGDLLPDMSVIKKDFPNELTNPRVSRVLAATMALVNSLIKRYGIPENIHIETARDISRKRNGRGKIFNENMNNFEKNQKMKYIIANELGVKSIEKVTKDDIEKLKLFYEQNELCMYSFEKIQIDQLFTTDVQVDHIIPYSRSFDNSYLNKTLVKTKYNQDKSNKTPYEYFTSMRKEDYSKFVNLVESNFKISNQKKLNYLAKDINDDFKSRSLNDTSFITKYFIKILKTYLNIDGNVIGYKAGIVNSLKKSWGLEYLTHSLVNSEYSSKDASKFSDVKVDMSRLTLIFTNELEESDVELTLKLAKDTEKMSPDDIKFNNQLKNVLENSVYLVQNKKDLEGKTMYLLLEHFVYSKELNQDLKASYISVLNQLLTDYNKMQIKKNRDNHLHHVLDATCVAVLSRKYEKRVTSFYQHLEEIKNDAIKSFRNNKIYVLEETEEAFKDFDELNSSLENLWMDRFPKPYDKFDLEVKYRIYEQNKEKQESLFKKNFDDGLWRNIRPIFPVYKAIKRKTMKLHKETFMGYEEFDDGAYLTKKVDSNKIKNAKEIAKIVEVKRGNKQLEKIFTDWIKNKESEYPLLPNGRPIKKIKCVDISADKSIKIADGKYAAIDKVARIDIYKSPNDDKLYFVQMNPVTIEKARLLEKDSSKDFTVQLWWGRDKNVKNINFSELNNYLLYKKLYPGQLINLTTKSGKAVCYANGFTSGMLEVRSVLGDGQDLIASGLSGKVKSQYYITISTIISIDKIKINNLGELGNLY